MYHISPVWISWTVDKMTMKQRKKITIITTSCANCPRGRFLEDIRVLWCDALNMEIKPSSVKVGSAIFYHDIPKKCPYPDTDEKDQFGC
jgi:hypothetical protein